MKNQNTNSDYFLDEEETGEVKDEGVIVNESKLLLIKNLSKDIKEKNNRLVELLDSILPSEEIPRISIGQAVDDNFQPSPEDNLSGKVIEGVFDGENMIGPDGKKYSIPSNYASKSKLVEGDIMKLSISNEGTFVYKQIGPIERKRIVGMLDRNKEGNFIVVSEDKKWYVLAASVTYYKGQVGDEVVLLVPRIGESKWGAVENIIRDNNSL